MQNLLIDKTNYKVIALAEEFVNQSRKSIFWISGRCGCGKTEFASSIIQKFERENKKTLKLSGKDFVDFLVENIKSRTPVEEMVYHFQKYDLLVLDDIDYALTGKPFTQREVKEAIKRIVGNNKTKVILVSQKRARKVRKLKFNSNSCLYLRLKSPTDNFKRKLVKNWISDAQEISKEECEGIISSTDNLFQLKGLCERIKIFKKIKMVSTLIF